MNMHICNVIIKTGLKQVCNRSIAGFRGPQLRTRCLGSMVEKWSLVAGKAILSYQKLFAILLWCL